MTREDIESKAREVLRKHGLYAIPVDPVILANRLGIAVFNAKFSDENLAGMIAKRGDHVQILVNQSDPPYRKRFTIAHELGHHFLHLQEDGEFTDTVDIFRPSEPTEAEWTPERRKEFEANAFAAAILMDSDLLRDELKRFDSVAPLARRFNVSEQAMGYRLMSLGVSA